MRTVREEQVRISDGATRRTVTGDGDGPATVFFHGGPGMPGAGHQPWRERPDAVAAALADVATDADR